MRCPFCGQEDTQVKDSRPSDDGASIRRRRACGACGARFTTLERVHLRDITVIKSSGDREPFERDKITQSMRRALRKRPIADEHVDRAVNSIVRQIEAIGDSDVPSAIIGEKVMESLRALDHVAYVRYASVYRDFRTPEDFNVFVQNLPRATEVVPEKRVAPARKNTKKTSPDADIPKLFDDV